MISFLQGYFNGDGNLMVYDKKEYRKTVILTFYVGIHKRQAYELQYMLWRLGISSQVTFRKRAKGIKGCYQVRISGNESYKKIINVLDPVKYPENFEHAKEVINSIESQNHFKESQREWLPITSVKKLGRQKVMAWQTLPSHEIISYEGLRTHNSGKTTWSKSLVHRLHELGGFTPHWFMRDEIQKIDTIISGLEKGVNHIVVLDDASFSLEELPKEKVNHLAKKLTYIRHEVKADVIVLMNIHYSKAIKKFFRAVPFTFLTSINMEEVNSFQDVFGSYARYKLRDFAWYFQQMMVKKQWTIELDKWAGKVQTYHTNKPFRLALANEINHLHFFVYSKNSCAVCDPDYQTKKIVDSEDFINKMDEKYNQQRMRAVLKTYALTRHGIPTWDTKRMAIWHTISDIDRTNRLDWKEIVSLLDKTSTNKRKRAYIKKGSIEKTVAELEESFKEREEDDLSTEGTMKDYKNQLESDLAEMESKKIGDDTLTEEDEKQFSDDKVIPNNGFGDDTQIDFGNDMNDSDGFNEDEDDN
jgi:hypothetical protein